MAELGKPSPHIDLLRTTGSNERPIFHSLTLTFDLRPLIFNPRLTKDKVDPHAKNQGQRSNGSNRRAPTDKRTDTRTLPNVLSPLLYAVDKYPSMYGYFLQCTVYSSQTLASLTSGSAPASMQIDSLKSRRSRPVMSGKDSEKTCGYIS